MTRYSYNSDNTVKTIIRRDGKTVTYTYDAAKRPISQSVDGDTIRYTYDAKGNILSAANSAGTINFEYDATGKLIKETQLGIDITTSYDKDSNVKTLSFLNKTVTYTRDKAGLVSKIDNITFAYDANNIQTKVTYPNGASEQNTFDAVYNIKKIQTANKTFNYTQDKTGLITSKNSTNYTYDNIGRLTQAGNDSFTYDKAGNNLNNNAVYNVLNNRLKQSDLYAITYDSMGNIKTKYNKITKETSTYTFNARNQLVKYTKQDENNQTVKTLEFTYDALGRRVSKTEDGVMQKYLYDGDNIIAILDKDNNIIATITHDESIDTPLSITNQNGTFYYHRDHQGSIVALTDENGNIAESFTYDNHYGIITNHNKTVETNNPYAYTGREFDTDELYYYRARYYDPTLQRFLSEDPIGFASGDFNWYRYVGNGPIKKKDPSGLEDCETINKDSGWYETLVSTLTRPVVVSLTKVFITNETGRKLSIGNCIWRLRKDIDEERRIRTYTICEICDTYRIINDTGEQILRRTRRGAEWTVITTGFPVNLNPKSKVSDAGYMSCLNPATGEWGIY